MVFVCTIALSMATQGELPDRSPDQGQGCTQLCGALVWRDTRGNGEMEARTRTSTESAQYYYAHLQRASSRLSKYVDLGVRFSAIKSSQALQGLFIRSRPPVDGAPFDGRTVGHDKKN